MADNLIELKQNVETFIDPSGVAGSILAQNHQNILKDVLAKVGKYVGSPYIATKEETNLLPGTMSWRGNAMNNTSLFQIDFAKLTADLNDFGLILSTLAEGDLIHFKDAKGRSVFLEYFNHKLTTGTSPVYQVNVKGKAENINYVYQDTEKLISIFQSYKQNTEAKEYEIQFIAPNFVLLEDGVPKTSIDLSVAITDTIQATETSLADFAVNSANYTFQQGDVISIVTTPDNLLELYLYKSGTKTDVNNYQKIDASKIDWSNILNKPENITKIGLKNENGILQFEIIDEILFEGFVIDVANKKIIAPKQSPNVIIEGIGNEVQDVTTLALFFRNSGGGSINPVDEFITNFKRDGVDISFNLLQDVKLNGAFRPNQLGQNVTKIQDIGGFIKEFGFQEFRGNQNVREIILPEVTNGTQNVIQDCTSLVKCVIPNSSGGSVNGCTSLVYLDMRNATVIGDLNGAPLTSFFNAQNAKLIQLNGFRNTGLTTVDLPNLISISAQSITQNSQITIFRAPRIESMTAGSVFRFDSLIEELYFPNLVEINPGGNTAHMFDMSELKLLYAPRCKVFGSNTVDNDFFRNRNLSGTVIVVNEFLKTSNSGSINVNIQDAINLGAKVIFANEFNQSFKEETIDISSTYVDDVSAGNGGVDLGERYIDTNGFIKVRLT